MSLDIAIQIQIPSVLRSHMQILKNQVEGNGYEAYRAGNINGETRYVLDTFGIKDPKYVSDVRPRLTRR